MLRERRNHTQPEAHDPEYGVVAHSWAPVENRHRQDKRQQVAQKEEEHGREVKLPAYAKAVSGIGASWQLIQHGPVFVLIEFVHEITASKNTSKKQRHQKCSSL